MLELEGCLSCEFLGQLNIISFSRNITSRWTSFSMVSLIILCVLFLFLQGAVGMAVPVNSCVTNFTMGCSSVTAKKVLCCTRTDTVALVSSLWPQRTT